MFIELEVYVREEQGVRYRVHDVAYGPPLASPHKRNLLALGDPRARYRLFVPADPDLMLRVHEFAKDGRDRGLTVEGVASQLRAAGYSPKRRSRRGFAPPARDLGGWLDDIT